MKLYINYFMWIFKVLIKEKYKFFYHLNKIITIKINKLQEYVITNKNIILFIQLSYVQYNKVNKHKFF